MTFPLDIHIGSIIIPSHFVFETLAYTLGFRYFLWLRKRQHDTIDSGDRIWIIIGAAFGALLGSRLVGVLENPFPLINGTATVFYWLGNKTIVGGLLGGLVGTEITKKLIHVRISSGDLITYPLLLAMILGRVGCFLAGLEDGTYGVATSLPWGIDFGDGIYRHPTNLYEIIFLGGLWVCLRSVEHHWKLADGARFKLFMTAYLLFRLCIEFIKPEYRMAGLGTIQIVCILGLLYYWQVFLKPSTLVERAWE